jgi:hypothetical protein
VQVPTTTYTGAATIHDPSGGGPASLGTPGARGPDCPQTRAGSLAGTALVGVFADLDSPIGDVLALWRLVCE